MTVEQIYSTTEVAHQLGIQRYQLDYLLETQQLPEPKLRVAGKRLWTNQDIERAAELLQATGKHRGGDRSCEGGHR